MALICPVEMSEDLEQANNTHQESGGGYGVSGGGDGIFYTGCGSQVRKTFVVKMDEEHDR